PSLGQRLGDGVEGAPPADAEHAGSGPEGTEVVGGRAGDLILGLGGVTRGHDDRVAETITLAEGALEPHPAGARVHDLDAHDATLTRGGQETADLPPSRVQ